MTENEAIDVILKDHSNFKNPMSKAYVMACKALEEIQQYRAIGTVEEFKDLKEKNTFNKVIDIRKSECPEDIEYFGSDELFGKCPHCEGMVNHTWNPCSCGDCGGLIDWSE